MKRAFFALIGAVSLAFLAVAFGCQNSSDDSSALLLAQAAAGQTPRETAGKKYDKMDGVWDFYGQNRVSFDSGTRKFGEFEFCGDYLSVHSDEMNYPLRLTVSNRSATLTYQPKGNPGSEAEYRLPEFIAFSEVDSSDAKRMRESDWFGYRPKSDDLFFKSGSDYLHLERGHYNELWGFYFSSDGERVWFEFRKHEENSPSGGGSGSISFSLQGKWKKQGDTLSGRYIQIKDDGSFDFYKNGSVYNLYTDRTFAQSGASVTVGYTASSISVSDKFTVSGSASEMKWTLEKSSSTVDGQTVEDTSNSTALLAFWEIVGGEVTLVPYE